jgi:ribosomal protein S12 methylthiotransferase accessory factor
MTMTISLQLPDGFPEKYNEAIHRAIDHCAVKRALSEPPEFVFNVLTAA